MNLRKVQLIVAATLLTASMSVVRAREPERLSLLGEQYPRAFFFRSSEQAHNERAYPTYSSWESGFSRLQGIIGKCLDEECLGRESRNPEFFSRFKRDHPTQVVLLHFNGNARDPRYQAEDFFPGHWIYEEATPILADVPAESGESVIEVEDAKRFQVNIGRYRTSNDDIALFGITDQGTHDWNYCEQVQLIAVDEKANTIRVRRGCYGTKPLRFEVGNSRAAAHVTEGPWGKNNNLMWYYNYTTHCPRDTEGKTCTDRLVDDLAGWFATDGVLAAFDGLEFDVLFNQTRGDTDGDGKVDDGIVDGINQYGIGVVDFAKQLRQRMGDDFIIQADGALGPGGSRSQRAWGYFNGIESEGFPNLHDWEFEDWSGGLNRHFYWRDHARSPAFSYVNHKWNEGVPGQPGVSRHPDVPFSRHRLSLAASQFFDAAICYSFAPARDPDGQFGIWDELRCGTAGKVGWLGAAEGPAMRLAKQRPDLLGGKGSGTSLESEIDGAVSTSVADSAVRVVATGPDADRVAFSVKGIPTEGSDLYVEVTMRADPMKGYPRSMARYASVGASGGMIDLMAGEPQSVGMKVRTEAEEQPLDESTGANLRQRSLSIDGDSRQSFAVHPPYRNGKGYTFWTRDVKVPKDAVLSFDIGMGELSPQRSDGVSFQVHVARHEGSKVGPFAPLFEVTTNKHQWSKQTVSLEAFEGEHVRLKFIADCGPKDNATTDHAHWADARIMKAGTSEDEITPMTQLMTWVGDRFYTSSFYFREVRSDDVDLTFDIEGAEPVWIESITAHAAPDAIARIFENGLIVANPSLHKVSFDLSRLTPGRSYRKIQATAKQDLKTNDGKPVGSVVTLPERDALFLIRQ